MADTSSSPGVAGFTASNTPHSVERVHRQRDMDERFSMMPVKIIAVHGGGVAAPPTVDVQPMVHSVDGLDQTTEHGTVYGVAVARTHSGSGAVISDPVAGDTGLMHVADRDIGTVKKTGAPSPPGSRRRGGLGDGVYHGAAFMQSAPTQALFFKPGGGVKLFDKGGAIVETSSDGKTVTVTPASGGNVYLGGDPAQGGTFAPVQTTQGPSDNVFAKVG